MKNLKIEEKKFWIDDINELYKMTLLILEKCQKKFP